MSLFTTFFVALVSGVLGLFVAGLVTLVCSEWLNVSSREGAAGYLLVFVSLIGGVVGLVIGLAVSRFVANAPEPSFMKAIAFSLSTILSLGGIAVLVGWLNADFAPTIDGRTLELEIEVRCPENFSLSQEVDQDAAYACVYVLGRDQSQQRGKIDFAKAGQDAGRWIMTAVVPLDSSSSSKSIHVHLSKDVTLSFELPLRRHPNRSDLDWSQWVDSGSYVASADRSKPSAGKFGLRYQVRLVEPPRPEPDPEDIREQEFIALKLNSDAPLVQWLPFLFESPRDERTRVVVQRIEERQVELASLIRSANQKTREYALRATNVLKVPGGDVVEAVLDEGREIVDGIRSINKLAADDPVQQSTRIELHARFRTWKEAWWGLSLRLGTDTRPPVQQIYDILTERDRDTASDAFEEDVLSLLEVLNQTAAKNASQTSD